MLTANKGVQASLHYINIQVRRLFLSASTYYISAAAAVMIDFRMLERRLQLFIIYNFINVITRGRVCGCFGRDGEEVY